MRHVRVPLGITQKTRAIGELVRLVQAGRSSLQSQSRATQAAQQWVTWVLASRTGQTRSRETPGERAFQPCARVPRAISGGNRAVRAAGIAVAPAEHTAAAAETQIC